MNTPDRTRDLTEKEQAFIQYFTDPAAPSYRSGPLAASAAGYKSCSNASWRLLQRPVVLAMIAKLQPQQLPTAQARDDFEDAAQLVDGIPSGDAARAEAYKQYLACIAKGDFANAARFLEMTHKSIGSFRDAGEVDPDRVRAYSLAEQQQAAMLAMLLIERGLAAPDAHVAAQDAPETMIGNKAGTVALPQTGRDTAAGTLPKHPNPSCKGASK